MQLTVWENAAGYICELVHRSWALEPWAIIRQGMNSPLAVFADRDEATAWGDAFAAAVCAKMNEARA